MLALLKKYDDRENGFTLIELLIVVLIIGILAAVAIPVYLGIQNQAHKAAVRSDVNITVKKTQVALTEGATLASLDTTAAPTTGGDKDKIYVTVAADGKSYKVIGTQSVAKGSPIDYTYTYDSTTGNFTEANTAYSLGGYDSASNTYTLTGDTFPTSTITKYSSDLNSGLSWRWSATTNVRSNASYPAPTLVATSAWWVFDGRTDVSGGNINIPSSSVKMYNGDGTLVNVLWQDQTRAGIFYTSYTNSPNWLVSYRFDLNQVYFNTQQQLDTWVNGGGYVVATYQGHDYKFTQ